MKKILIVGSSGNLGRYLFNKLKKTDYVLGVQRKNNQKNFLCKDLANSNVNFETFRLIKKSIQSWMQ